MRNKLYISIAAAVMCVLGLSFATATLAEQHTEEALRHADEAAKSSGDSQAIGEHASEALKHIDAAKAAQAANPEAVKHLEESEAELNASVSHARRFNTGTATENAEDAKRHLEQAETKIHNRTDHK